MNYTQQLSLFKLILCLVSGYLISQNEALTLESIWKSKNFIVNLKSELKWTPNGNSYTQIVKNTTSGSFDIAKFELTSGLLKDTVLKGEILKKYDPTKDWVYSDYLLNSTETHLLVAINEEPIYRHSSQAEYYLVNLKNKKVLPLCSCFKVSLVEFSPDGKLVSFVRENNLYIFDIESQKEIQVSDDGLSNHVLNGMPDWVYEEEFSIKKAYTWSIDSKFLAFLRFDESKVPLYSLQKWGEGLYPVSEKYRYPKAGENNSNIKLKVYDVMRKNTTTLSVEGNNEQYIPRINFINENSLFVQTLNRLQNDWKILRYKLPENKLDTIYSEKSNTYIEITNDLFFFESEQQLIISSDKSGFRHLLSVDLKTKQEKQLTNGNWEVDKILGADSKTGWIYFTSNIDGVRFKNLYRYNLFNDQLTSLSERNGNYEIRLSPDHKFYIQNYSNIKTPPVISVHLNDGRLIRFLEKNSNVTDFLKKLKLGEPEFTTLKTPDDVELEICILKPRDFDKKKKYPTLFYVYGGPNYQVVLDMWQYNNYLWHQFLCQQGFMVVMLDPRGSGGKGREFSHVNYMKLGRFETRDITQAAKVISKWPNVDSKNIGIWGWSYGGYVSTLALAMGNDVFNYAISIAPVTDWKLYDNIYTERYLRTPKENPKGYEEYSPLNHVEEIKGNYLLVHGTADDNVHVQHSMLMQKALVDAEKQFQYFVYSDKNHGIYGGVTRYHLYTMMFNFIKSNQK
ncbi:MAG: S9 family peptidase [Cytophagales bacterium]